MNDLGNTQVETSYEAPVGNYADEPVQQPHVVQPTPQPEAVAPVAPVAQTAPTAETEENLTKPVRLPLRAIQGNPYQPRRDFPEEDLVQLSESLKTHGLLQPVVVRRVGEKYQLIAGERRMRAASMAGWKDVPVQVVDADEQTTAELAIIENVQRKDLNAIEKAASFREYIDAYECTHVELAKRLHMDRSTVSNLMRLLELPDPVQESVRAGRISQGHARALLPLGDPGEQLHFCKRIQAEKMSVRDTESSVQAFIAQEDSPTVKFTDAARDTKESKQGRTSHLAQIEQEFKAALGSNVKLTHGAGGKGKIVIAFKNHNEFERLRELLCEERAAEDLRRAG